MTTELSISLFIIQIAVNFYGVQSQFYYIDSCEFLWSTIFVLIMITLYFKFLMKSVSFSKPGYTSMTCSKIANIPYNCIFTTKFNDSSISITIISWDYLNKIVWRMNTLTTSQYQPRLSCVTNVDQPIRLQYSPIKLFINEYY